MSTDSSPPPIDDQPQLADLVRILDVAAEMRSDREMASQELAVDETKKLLRERLIESARLTGETATPEEVDAAIQHYYQSLYTFHKPKWNFEVTLAHLYVWRIRLGIATVGMAVVLATGWLSFGAKPQPIAPVSPVTPPAGSRLRSVEPAKPPQPLTQQPTPQQPILQEPPAQPQPIPSPPTIDLDALQREIKSLAATIQETTTDPEATALIHDQVSRLHVAAQLRDAKEMEAVRQQLIRTRAALDEDYEVRVVSNPKAKSGMDRYYNDQDGKRISGFYLLVEAHTRDGRILNRQVKNAETGNSETVTIWGESIPEAVWERIKADKKSDGILDETLFAVKKRGQLNSQIVMQGVPTVPSERRQITKW